MYSFHPQTVNFIFFHLLFILVLITSLRLADGSYKGVASRELSFALVLVILVIMGLRPYNTPGVGQYFGDTINYYHAFDHLASGLQKINHKDAGFGWLFEFFVRYLNAGAFFFVLSALYLLPAWYAIKRFSPNHPFLLFLMFASYFLFWSNGVNGIRVGIASSWFLLAFSYPNKRWLQLLLCLLAVSFHKSILLPIGAYVITLFYANTKGYVFAWFSSIVLSLLLGGFWETFFAGFDLGDERFSQYLTTEADASVFAYTGFRWDFIIYSAIPVALGAHYIFKTRYTNKLYIQLFNTYLVANSFWILVIRASFSNRFASLSWFLIPIIILFPLLKRRVWTQQEAKIGLMLFLSFVFTYFMSFNIIWK